jgi:hypothetical protein
MSFWYHRFDQNSFFVPSWRLLGSFLGLPGDLVTNIINKKAYRKPQMLPGSSKEAKKLSE